MSEWCSPAAGETCSIPQGKPGVCPVCEKKGKSVSTLTVKSLVRGHTRVSVNGSYSFCRTPDCEVVYFSSDAIFRKPDVKVRVGFKEGEDPVPLCYCFEYTRADVQQEMEELGTSQISQKVKAEVQAGLCACEVKNPSGGCCLGEINRTIQELKKLSSLAAGQTPGRKS